MSFNYHVQSGTISDPIVSHSGLCTLDPDMGGHPLDFVAFIQRSEDDIKTSPSFERGDLLHKWLEKPNDFVFAELAKPAPQMAAFAEAFYNLYFKKQYETRAGFTEFCNTKVQLDMEDLIKVNKIYQSFHGLQGSNEEVQLLIRCILFARYEAEVNKNLTLPKVIEKFETECMAYIRFLHDAGDRTIVDSATKNILINCHASITRHPLAKQYLHEAFHSEEEIFWTEVWEGVTIKRKAKLDKHRFENNKLQITDFKTTSKPVAEFKEGAFKKYKLGRQLVNYAKAFCSKHNLDFNTIELELVNVVVQTTGNYPTIVFKLTDDTIRNYVENYETTLKRVAYHIKNNVWDITMEEHQNGFIMI